MATLIRDEMSKYVKDLTGLRFGRLLANSYAGRKIYKSSTTTHWNCTCDCGTERVVTSNSLLSGSSKSCGCYNREIVSKLTRKHGHTMHGKHTPEYGAWRGILSRCNNPNNKHYRNYGGKGITVCKEWASSFEVFLGDMGLKPSDCYTIDRIKSSGNYEPGNCRWATRTTQNRNTNRNHYLEFNGKSQCISAWAVELSISKNTLLKRIRSGWSIEKTLTTKVDKRQSRTNRGRPKKD